MNRPRLFWSQWRSCFSLHSHPLMNAVMVSVGLFLLVEPLLFAPPRPLMNGVMVAVGLKMAAGHLQAHCHHHAIHQGTKRRRR